MWRYDAARSAASPDELPARLHLRWIRQLPKPRPAWPASQTKLQFDGVCQPIVVGKLVIVGSTENDSITAYDSESGKEVWRFYTDGPVRFAHRETDEGIIGHRQHGGERQIRVVRIGFHADHRALTRRDEHSNAEVTL